MILIFGGAYQGKLEYAKENWNIGEDEIFTCTEKLELDPEKRVYYGLEKFIYACVLEGKEPKDVISQIGDANDKIFIVNDISQGVVPIEADRRAWREAVGRTMLWLGKNAEEVHRVFCGLGQRLK
jgi:adenosyl cobinamide kinase/adenosyl cobinamide phosphate guanylyltransferase